MNINDFENRTFDELRQGYYRNDNDVYVCLHCPATCDGLDEMETHQETTHRPNKDALFLTLLNADSLNGLSYDKKMVYYYIYRGLSDSDIAAKLDMIPETVRSHRYLLREKYKECKDILLLCEMMNLEKQSDGAAQPAPVACIPALDAQGMVTGFYTKEEVHSEAPKRHPSVLILTAQRDANGTAHYLISTKSSKMLTYAGAAEVDSKRIKKRWIDIQGGQCHAADGAKKGKPLSEAVFTAASERVLKREVYLKGDKPDAAKLTYLYTDETDKEGTVLFPSGRNIEITNVYLYRLPDDMPHDRIMIRDTWTDSLGGSRTKRYPAEFATWAELEGFAASDEIALMDGARRVVERMQRDPALKKKMFALLECAEG